MARTRNSGLLLTGIWLILHGLFGLVTIVIPGQALLMSLLAVVAGALLIAGR